jgi:2-polyprenyl-3-methyl-5-hydroxy-6-metoxy-1,4-benzoquinol methylase
MSFNFETKERDLLYEFCAAVGKEIGAKNILDIASSDGYGTIVLAKVNDGAIVTGIDIVDASIEKALSAEKGSNVHFKVGDIRKIDEKDGSFDFVVSFHTIEHLSEADQATMLQELKRVLTPGGILLIATPDREVWELQGIAGTQEDHVRELSKKEFIKVVTDAGFAVEEAFGQGILKKRDSGKRKILNLIKKADVFKLRRLVGKKIINSIDTNTQPIALDFSVKALGEGETGSVVVLKCRKADANR